MIFIDIVIFAFLFAFANGHSKEAVDVENEIAGYIIEYNLTDSNTININNNNNNGIIGKKLCEDVLLTAHRGATFSYDYYAPENTFAAAEEAFRLQADLLEMDIRQSSDGFYILMHDSTLDRTTNCSGDVTSYTFAFIRQNCIPSNPLWEGPQQIVPTLEEAMQWLVNYNMSGYLDMKTSNVEGALDIVNSFGLIEHVWIYGGMDTQRRARAAYPNVGMIPRTDSIENTQQIIAEFYDPYPDFEIPNQIYIDVDNINFIHSLGSRVFMDALGWRDIPGILGQTDGWKKMLDSGVDVMQTDFPGAARDFLNSYCSTTAH